MERQRRTQRKDGDGRPQREDGENGRHRRTDGEDKRHRGRMEVDQETQREGWRLRRTCVPAQQQPVVWWLAVDVSLPPGK
ncbi:hypothetical protein NHX12_014248, partial [Muraenolepis orangiensis]